MNRNWTRAIVAGLAATLVMTAVGVWLGPLMGFPPMNPADMLAAQMDGSVLLGWIGHLTIGVVLALIYALVAPWLPGAPWLRGALYSLAPWLVAQVAVMPMIGMPVFSGSGTMALGSLVGHLVYGVLVGAVYGDPVVDRASRHAIA